MAMQWKSYEDVAVYLLDQHAQEFGLHQVEGKQTIRGERSGTEWEIDAKGVRNDNEGVLIIECRRYTTSKQNQEKLGSLAYRIIDTGAEGGIIVSPLGIQEGAAKIAAAENILNVQLDADSTPTQFAMKFLNKLMIGIEMEGVASVSCSAEILRFCHICEERFTVIENEKVCSVCQKVN